MNPDGSKIKELSPLPGPDLSLSNTPFVIYFQAFVWYI